MYMNIAEYLVEHDERALVTRLENDYKEGKLITLPYFVSALFHNNLDKLWNCFLFIRLSVCYYNLKLYVTIRQTW
jgi:hypothetical protein